MAATVEEIVGGESSTSTKRSGRETSSEWWMSGAEIEFILEIASDS